jgi:dihydropteroate synthase
MSKTQIMGIVNITPDSFSDGNKYFAPDAAIERINEVFAEGAALADIGAESTNPKSSPLSPDQEWARLLPVLEKVFPKYADRISIDSYHPETIDKIASTYGPRFILNDVTGFNDPRMITVAVTHRLRCIISHLPARVGTNIQAAHKGKLIDSVQTVKDELLARYAQLHAAGLAADQIILDPGIGFGKTPELNMQLLEFPKLVPEHPVMIGHSRKRFLGADRFNVEVNLAAARIAIAAGAAYLRVHDVAAHVSLVD